MHTSESFSTGLHAWALSTLKPINFISLVLIHVVCKLVFLLFIHPVLQHYLLSLLSLLVLSTRNDLSMSLSLLKQQYKQIASNVVLQWSIVIVYSRKCLK